MSCQYIRAEVVYTKCELLRKKYTKRGVDKSGKVWQYISVGPFFMLYEKSGIEHKGGPSVQAYVACPGCGEREFVMVMGVKWRFTRWDTHRND